VAVAGPGTWVFKPRHQWHTFWNAGDEPLRILEVISPGGLEELFRALDLLPELPDPDTLARMAEPYEVDLDMEGTMPIVERHGLAF
jgi:hypothetical protein